MIQKRNSIFETNSSSVHAIIICEGQIQKIQFPPIIKHIRMYFGLDSWVYTTPIEKLLYLYSAINYVREKKDYYLPNLETWMYTNNINILTDTVDIQIDSIEQLVDFVLGLETKTELVDLFIYCRKSKIYTSSDGVNDTTAVKIIKRWNVMPCSTMGWQYHKSRKRGGCYYVYGKGN